MTLEQVVIWIIIGGIAGLLAEAFVRGVRVGLVGTVIAGILGALLGGWLFRHLGLHIGTGILSEIIAAFVGAVILLLIMRGLRRLSAAEPGQGAGRWKIYAQLGDDPTNTSIVPINPSTCGNLTHGEP